METAGGKALQEERNRLILVRTLGIVSWLYAAERTLVGLALLRIEGGEGILAPRTFGPLSLAHAALLGVAGAALLPDRRWAWVPALGAAVGAASFAVLEGLNGIWTNAAVDAAYVLIAAVTLLKPRRALPADKPPPLAGDPP